MAPSLLGRWVVDSPSSDASRHDEPPLIQHDPQTVQNQLAWESLLSVHEVRNKDEEDNEDVRMHNRREEEVVR